MRNIASVLWILVAASACSSSSGDSEGNAGGADAGVAEGDAGTTGVSFGGAQDFGDFQEILANGGIPGPETLDANGFFNEHELPPPAVPCASTLCMAPGLSVGRDWLTSQHQATLQIALDTDVDPTQYTRRPLDVAVVVDRSGSMASDGRLDKVQLGLTQLIAGLQDGDRMALVTFSDSATVIAPLAALDRDALTADVAAIIADGGTDIYDGLAAGFNQLPAPTADREQRVIFLSDGEATVGDVSQADIFALADSYISTGIGLTTIGVGADFDLDLMRGLAEQGAGNFYFLQDDASTTEVFTDELAYFMSPIALDVSIQVTAGEGYQLGEEVGSTLWSASATTGSLTVPAVFVANRLGTSLGSAGSGDGSGSGSGGGSGSASPGRRGGGSMIFIALTAQGPFDAAGTVGTMTMTYKVPGATAPSTQTLALTYPGDPLVTPIETYLSEPAIAKRYAMYNLFLGLRAATNQLDLDCASADLFATQSSAEAWNAPHADSDITADIAIVGEYLANLATAGSTATAATPIASCAQLDNGDNGSSNDCNGRGDGDGSCDEDYPVDEPPPAYGCMDAGGGPAGLLGLAIASVVAGRRRRRRG